MTTVTTQESGMRTVDGVTTNLTDEEYDTVLLAVHEGRVVWDDNKRIVHDEYASGEFDYEGQRYKLDEEFEILKGLIRLSPATAQ